MKCIPRYEALRQTRCFHGASQYLSVPEPLAVARKLKPELRASRCSRAPVR